MRLRVIATDYDGTIAQDGVLSTSVREAIHQARQRGVLVVIVTGRILSELRNVAGCLDFVDGVVAENGAIVNLPNGHTILLGRPPPMSLITKLTRRGIDFKVGRCVVEMDAEFADVAISLIRELELPLSITFNRGRMMLLPPSISKAGGLRELLNTLGVSVHNTIGIGDAENDHELLNVCEHGVAVSWGSERLKRAACSVIEGDGPVAVGRYIERVSAELTLPPARVRQRKLVLEEIDGQPPLQISIQGRNVLVAGDTRSGKSWLAGLFIEQQILMGYTVYVFDPEGDYTSLSALPNTVVLGGGRFLPHGDDLTMLLAQGINVVLNLSHLDHPSKMGYVQHHLSLVAAHRRKRGFPHRILLDECHYFLNGLQDQDLLDTQLHAYTLVTYRPSELPASLRKLIDVVVVSRLAEQVEVDALRELLNDHGHSDLDSEDWYEPLANLAINEAVLLPPTEELGGKLRRFVVAPRLTTHVRHRTKYFDTPVREGREFVFTHRGQPVGAFATTLRQLAPLAQHVGADALAGHCQHHDFSRWIAGLFCDHDLAHDVRQLESMHQRSASTAGFAAELSQLIERRYEST